MATTPPADDPKPTYYFVTWFIKGQGWRLSFYDYNKQPFTKTTATQAAEAMFNAGDGAYDEVRAMGGNMISRWEKTIEDRE